MRCYLMPIDYLVHGQLTNVEVGRKIQLVNGEYDEFLTMVNVNLPNLQQINK